MKKILLLFCLLALIFISVCCNPYIQHFKNLTTQNGVLDRHDQYVKNDPDLKNLPEVKQAFLNESNSYRTTAKRVLEGQ